MPTYKTNLGALNQAKPLELELEINSFAGGENTIGEDQALKVNEARIIQNWDALSLGGMERSKGFLEIADAPKTIKTAVFTGSGLDDGTSDGTYSGTVTATYTIIIDHEGTPDSFKWKKNSGSFTEDVAITGSAQTLSDGVTITFAATTGHTAGDQWVITAKVYTSQLDLVIQHIEDTTTRIYTVQEGDLMYKNGSSLTLTDSDAFTSGVLCHAVSKGDKLWITNATDNLKYKTNGGSITVPTDQPASARDRVYYHKYRLIAEGGGKTIYGSRAGTGNWTSATAWSESNDAWSIDLPDYTQGCAVGFPSGDYVTAFTKWGAYLLSNFPNVGFSQIIGGHGCSFPYTIAIGTEGCYLLSEFPSYGVFLWNGVQWTNLTINHDFIDDIDRTKRIYGVYRDNKYYLIYNETGSGVSYPDRIKIYDARFGRWMTRSINASLGDYMGYPALAPYTNNELYFGSSYQDKLYQFETADTSDDSYNTEALYRTKNFSSRDFSLATGGEFTIEDVRMKLIKFVISFYGTAGNLALLWSADNGTRSGSQTIGITAEGDQLNSTFTVNTSYITSVPPDATLTRSFSNSAIGRKFSFDITNTDTGTRPKVKRIKIYAIALEEA
jgi:hypothetical protein